MDDGLFRDQAMNDHLEAIAFTVFLFLLTHAPDSPEEPLKGILTCGHIIVEECRITAARPYSALCDLLGSVGVLLTEAEFCWFLSSKDFLWKHAVFAHVHMGEAVYRRKREQSEALFRHTGQGFDSVNEGDCWSTYQWTILREMFYHSRLIEMSQQRRNASFARRETDKGWRGLQSWLDQEWKLEHLSEVRKHMHIAWYGLPIAQKIRKLDQMINFLEYRLPAERAREEKLDILLTGLQEKATRESESIHEDFRRMEGLQHHLREERWIWQRNLLEMKRLGGPHDNSTYPGFPLRRHYQYYDEMPCSWKPEPPDQEGVEAYSSIPLAVLTKAYKPRFNQRA